MNLKQWTSVAVIVLVSTGLAIGFNSGPPNGVTGAPGESNCRVCHTSFPLNVPGGNFRLTSSTSAYTPGETLLVSVSLSRPGQRIWGFMATVLNASNTWSGTLIGGSGLFSTTFTSTAPSGRQYVKQNSLGNYATTPDSSPGWTFRWVAPANFQGPVTFYAAGNAGNLSETPIGDYIYTTTLTIPSIPCCSGLLGNVDCDLSQSVDVIDLTALVDHLFISFSGLCCEAAADLDNSGGADLIDLTLLVDYLYISFTPPGNCP